MNSYKREVKMNSKLAEDIVLAIGDRSYSQINLTTGISKTTLSRMVNQKFTRKINPNLLWKLSVSAQNNITFELLMMDAGFSFEETHIYRSKYNNKNVQKSKHMSSTSKSLSRLILQSLSKSGHDNEYKITPCGEELTILRLSATSNKCKIIYILDSSPKSSELRVCELIGRCILEKSDKKASIHLVTTQHKLYLALIDAPPIFSEEVILTNETGEYVIERKVLYE